AGRALRAKTNRRSIGKLAPGVGERTRASAANLEDQLRRAFDAPRAEFEIDAALEAIAGVADEAEASHLSLNHGGIPERAFEVNARRVVRDAGMLAAHDAREAKRLHTVADEQQV